MFHTNELTPIIDTGFTGEMVELAEGAPLLREYGVKSSIEGSNPSLSAICTGRPGVLLPKRAARCDGRKGLQKLATTKQIQYRNYCSN